MARSRSASPHHHRAQQQAGLGRAVAVVVEGQQLTERRRAVATGRVVQGRRHEAAVAGQRLDDVLGALLEPVGDLLGPRGAAELVGQLGVGHVDPGLELLDPARRPDHPAVVAEVLAQLAPDGRDGVGEEVVARGHVVPLARLGQRQGRHLPEVVQRDAARAVAGGLGVGQVEVHHDHDVQQPPLLGGGGLEGLREQLARVGRAIVGAATSSGRRRMESLRSSLTDLCPSPRRGVCRTAASAIYPYSTQASGRWLQLDTRHRRVARPFTIALCRPLASLCGPTAYVGAAGRTAPVHRVQER